MRKEKAIILLLCLFSLAACDTKSMNYIIKNKSSVTGTVEEIHENYIILYSDSAEGYPYGSRWQISLNAENKASTTDLAAGDEIVVYHDGHVMETDPLKPGKVYVITLKTPANRNINKENSSADSDEIELTGISAEAIIDVSVSYANWTEESELYTGALNREKMSISSVRHLPFYKLDTLEDLSQFKKDISELLSTDVCHDEIPSFNQTTANYDESFFENNTLMLVYMSAGSGTYRFGVKSIYCDKSSFCIQINQLNHPEVVTWDMAGWFITVAVSDSIVDNCTDFDAFLYSSEN